MATAEHQVYVDRWRARARSRRVHDWHLSLLPAAIETIPRRGRAIELCKVLCDLQRDYHPEVIIATAELAASLNMDRRNLHREIRVLMHAGLLLVVIGGGRLAGRPKTGKADVYRLGPRVRIPSGNRVTHDAVSDQISASPMTQYPEGPEIVNCVTHDAPTPFGVLRTPSGDTGERTAALTGGPTPDQSSPATHGLQRLRETVSRLFPVSMGLEHRH